MQRLGNGDMQIFEEKAGTVAENTSGFSQAGVAQGLRLGLDIGSTTIKAVLIDEQGNILFAHYERHLSHIKSCLSKILAELDREFPLGAALVSLTGSGALLLSEHLDLPFVQEVIAGSTAVRKVIPQTSVAIELGGEDAKLTFFTGGIDQRMNETCAGGTGAFIDQMAVLLKTDAPGLNELAKSHKTIYPIASRCGVFAKTDVVALLNEGASRNDIAASIFQAVVDQTIGGLACGRPITGKVAFLGGPLYFLSELRQRFIETLQLAPEDVVFPERAEQFVALGAAYSSHGAEPALFSQLVSGLAALDQTELTEHSESMPRLFESEEEYAEFLARHEVVTEEQDLAGVTGPVFLGLDMGSTTVKAALIDETGRVLTHRYQWGRGDALGTARRVVLDILRKLPKAAFVRHCAVTGYGSAMLKAALGFDIEEVETMAHFKAANHILPGVSFILDIGGQDIKCMQVRKGNIQRIYLNEACSAGCGAFIETFAESLGFSVQEFTKAALWSRQPLDLGSRCTVFMNSKVRCAQKEGVDVEDIAAGLAYAVARNALYKVICIRRPEDLGDKVVVQGGAFINNALLRTFEIILGREVVRPPLPGLMGAFGAALVALERGGEQTQSSLLSLEELEAFTSDTHTQRCMLCGNRCLMTVSNFPGGRKFVSGNKCARGAGEELRPSAPNLFAERYKKIFDYQPLPPDQAPRGEIGIPRVLNMYENYPLWFTIFTELGFSVQLSNRSSRKLFESGLGSIPSQTVCYPAKLVHGHILDLARRGIKRIFYPCIPNESRDDDYSDNNFNCPIVCGYPQTVDHNVDELDAHGVEMLNPFLPLDNPRRLAVRLAEELNLPKAEVRKAVDLGFAEVKRVHDDLTARAEEVLSEVEASGGTAIVLAGRPYHLDPAVHHSIPERIAQQGVAVLAVDDVMHLAPPQDGLLRVVNQWTYHSRLYRAAAVVAERPYCELIQLTSFGCGLDAITSEQVEEVLESKQRVYTLIKMDEGSSLGAARLRITSLLALIAERKRKAAENRAEEAPASVWAELSKGSQETGEPFLDAILGEEELENTDEILAASAPVFTADMRETHTILAPQLSPIHFQFIAPAMEAEGYKLAILPDVNAETIEIGLKYVNNDLCYPAIITIGQLVQALTSGEYDPERTALVMSQTGGVCRATNYISCLRKAVVDAGFGHVPTLSFNMEGFGGNPGFKITGSMLRRMAYGCVYGDLLQRLSFRARPYELESGAVDALTEECAAKFLPVIRTAKRKDFIRAITETVRGFEEIPLGRMDRPRVGIVGEILLKYHPAANNQVAKLIESQGGEVVPTDIMDFFLYCAYGDVVNRELLHGSWGRAALAKTVIAYIEWLRNDVRKALKDSTRFEPPGLFTHLADKGRDIVSLGQSAGEGWLLTAEMVEFLENGVPNILCVQPFGCLPNHVIGRGMFKEIKRRYPQANLAAVDYDPGASQGNQINRLKLLMAVALEKNLDKACRPIR